MRVRRWLPGYRAFLPIAACLLATTLSALSATTVTFTDDTFDQANWDAEIIENSTQFGIARFAAQQLASGGNPGAFRRVEHTFLLGLIGVGHLNQNAVYQPSGEAIFAIEYSYDLIQFNPPGVTEGVGYGLLLFQNETYYRVVIPDTILVEEWTRFNGRNLQPDDFVRAHGDGPMLPDFSANAPPIQFGYISRNTSQSQLTQKRESGIDNWSVTVRSASFLTVSAASFEFGEPLAPEAIAAGYAASQDIVLAPEQASAVALPLPTELAGTRVQVSDIQGETRLAGLYFVGPGQINFAVPKGTARGAAVVTVVSSGGAVLATGPLEIDRVAPGLFSANAQGKGVAAAFVLRVAPDGSQNQQSIYNPNTLDPVPISLGSPQDSVYLILFGTGIRGYVNSVMAGVSNNNVEAVASKHSFFVGLDQINVGPLPRTLVGAGTVNVVIQADGVSSNRLTATFQ